MANGLLAPMTTNPAELARQQGFGYLPPQRQAGGAPGMFGGPGGMNQLKQFYGAMLPGAQDNPLAFGQGFVRAMQQQQQINQENSPMGQLLRMYGQVNPRDWKKDSMQRFHDNLVRTGKIDFGLLERYEPVNNTIQKAIGEADKAASEAWSASTQADRLAQRYWDQYLNGDFDTGLIGTAKDWIANNITGIYSDQTALVKDFTKYRNEQAIKDLPPGVASDRDVQITMAGLPTGRVSPEYLAAYMRGVQKLKLAEYARAAHRSGYLTMNQRFDGITEDWAKRGQRNIERLWRQHDFPADYTDSNISDLDWMTKKYGILGQRSGPVSDQKPKTPVEDDERDWEAEINRAANMPGR